MRRLTLFVTIALGLLLQGQKAAEQFIPIGKSPGLSGKVTYQGKIGAQDVKAKSIGGDSWSATVTDKTHIWIDRSKQKKAATVGTIEDLQAGRVIEVKYEGREAGKKSGPAEWIKVEAAEPPKK